MKKTKRWIHAMTQLGQHAEMMRLEQGHPTSQQLQQAIKLIGAALNDADWVQRHDPGQRLKQVLQTLIELTSGRSRSQSNI